MNSPIPVHCYCPLFLPPRTHLLDPRLVHHYPPHSPSPVLAHRFSLYLYSYRSFRLWFPFFAPPLAGLYHPLSILQLSLLCVHSFPSLYLCPFPPLPLCPFLSLFLCHFPFPLVRLFVYPYFLH